MNTKISLIMNTANNTISIHIPAILRMPAGTDVMGGWPSENTK